MNCFAHLIVHHPYTILLAVAVFSTTCLIIPFIATKLPNFKDPQLGFETRGTVLAKRQTAWKNLVEAASPSGFLTGDPRRVNVPSSTIRPTVKKKKLKHKHKNITILYSQDTDRVNRTINLATQIVNISSKSEAAIQKNRNKWKTLQNLQPPDRVHFHRDHKHVSVDGFFCGVPSPDYAHAVIGSEDQQDLFSYNSLMAICHIERTMTMGRDFDSLCQTVKPGYCCHSWSLPNYVAMINNRTSCLSITEEDINATISELRLCAQYYHNLHLMPNCYGSTVCEVPPECSRHDAVYNIFNYLVDTKFLPPNDTTSTFLKYTMLFLPIASSSAALPFYHSLNARKLQYHHVKVVAMDFGLKQTLFDSYLLNDAWFIGAGALFVLICMWIYTNSIFVTVMTIVAIFFSLGISYFIYTLVFELRFFPFMNLLASIVSVGIGADDAFIFCKIWQCGKSDKNNSSIVKLVTDTLHHAVLSMFVTSLTTAAAFYSSFISSITAVCCFSIFAGTAVMANFGLMITWFPACVVISQRWSTVTNVPPRWKFWDDCCRLTKVYFDNVWTLFDRLIILLVLKLRWFWLLSLGSLTVISIMIIFYHPKLSLPDSQSFQLFERLHPFEQYDFVFKEHFWFERLQQTDNVISDYKLPMRFVWGVLAVDNGDYLDPHSRGSLEFDETFDISAPESQKWLLNFCQKIRMQPFYQSTLGPLLPNCFIESFVGWMQRRCLDEIDDLDRSPCCETSKFPYKRTIFDKCIVEAMADLYETPSEYFMPGMAGLKFSKDQKSTIKALVVEYDSNYSYSVSFNEMNRFFKEIESWLQVELKQAPNGMNNGWFVSELEFYDLQRTLSKDMTIAIGVSMCIALIVLLLVTLNVLVSCYAILCIACCIFVTVAILVMLGWKLNVLESVAVSTAIGLAVDFSLHYGINYGLCTKAQDRETATKFTISRMAGPTAMAALTTGAAGAFMLPSSVLAYIQIGIFLLIIMTVSWIYSTFLLGSLLSIAGPQNGFGQFKYSMFCFCKRTKNASLGLDSVSVADPDTRKSSLPESSTVHGSENHELENLTARDITAVRPTSFIKNLQDHSCSNSAANVPLVSYTNSRKSFSLDQSPSATSAITIILGDHEETEPKIISKDIPKY